ncbi:MAG: UvrB/UvrC motif-containing protein [Opitutales bacterium]
MAEGLKCDLCDAQATVHLTQIVDKQIHKVNLCESCAQKKGVTDPEGFSLSDLLAQNIGGDSALTGAEGGAGLRCEKCGYTAAKLKKTGRLGCPVCYDAMGRLVSPMLDNIHRGTRHLGKVPHRLLDRLRHKRRLRDLQALLDASIKEERYEDAAQYRDQIEQLKLVETPADVSETDGH